MATVSWRQALVRKLIEDEAGSRGYPTIPRDAPLRTRFRGET